MLERMVFFFFAVLALISCDKVATIVCGDFGIATEARLDSINRASKGHMLLVSIPCEYSYIDLYLQTDIVDTARTYEPYLTKSAEPAK